MKDDRSYFLPLLPVLPLSSFSTIKTSLFFFLSLSSFPLLSLPSHYLSTFPNPPLALGPQFSIWIVFMAASYKVSWFKVECQIQDTDYYETVCTRFEQLICICTQIIRNTSHWFDASIVLGNASASHALPDRASVLFWRCLSSALPGAAAVTTSSTWAAVFRVGEWIKRPLRLRLGINLLSWGESRKELICQPIWYRGKVERTLDMGR